MADAEFISILMLVMLENDFVGFPQNNLNELYVKYDFNLNELPSDDYETEEDHDDEQEGLPLVTQEHIESFEENFNHVKDTVHGIVPKDSDLMSYISKKPLTHIYSLWALIAFNLQENFDEVHIYERFCSLLKKCTQFSDKDFKIENISTDAYTQAAYKYHTYTTGAATEKGPRQKRHEALMEYVGWAD